jgi:hypothetical protein
LKDLETWAQTSRVTNEIVFQFMKDFGMWEQTKSNKMSGEGSIKSDVEFQGSGDLCPVVREWCDIRDVLFQFDVAGFSKRRSESFKSYATLL